MDRETAISEARAIATSDRVAMVVTENPYAEHESERFSYYPARAEKIFIHETVIERIPAGG